MIRVLLVDDDALVRSGLRMMLAGAASLELVAEAADGREVLAAVDLHRPDVVLMDIRMPQLDGIAATRLLAAQPDPPAVLVLTTFDADELVLRALQAGAAGFLLKHTPPAEIVRAIELVHASVPQDSVVSASQGPRGEVGDIGYGAVGYDQFANNSILGEKVADNNLRVRTSRTGPSTVKTSRTRRSRRPRRAISRPTRSLATS